jgi:hypothetical protein
MVAKLVINIDNVVINVLKIFFDYFSINYSPLIFFMCLIFRPLCTKASFV